jgi:hypothetical protein
VGHVECGGARLEGIVASIPSLNNTLSYSHSRHCYPPIAQRLNALRGAPHGRAHTVANVNRQHAFHVRTHLMRTVSL